MGDEARSLYSQQRSAAVFGMVKTLFEIRKCAARQERADLAGHGCSQGFFEHVSDKMSHAFRSLESDIAHEAVGNHYVNRAAVEVAAFHVADEIDGEALEESKRFAGEF